MKKTLVVTISIVLLICLWYLAAAAVGASVILPTPSEVVLQFFRLLGTKAFYISAGATVLRALVSFVIIVITGLVFGLIAGRCQYFEWAIQPLVTVFKATPVMSIILLAYIWLNTGKVPVFSAFLMAFPIMFVQVLNGVRGIDRSLEQVCTIYKLSGAKKLFNFTIPAIAPSIVTGSKQTLSMIWKVVIAAEVITIPKAGIGRSLQLAQVNLETAKVFALTVTAIILTAAGDFLLKLLLGKIVSRRALNENS